MSTEELLIALARVFGSLPVLRWPFAGGVLAVLVDLSDLFMMNLLRLGGVSDYQAFDKWLDQVYLACFLVVALRWQDPMRSVAVALYGLRLAGFVAFEVTDAREVLVLFPNLFEFWFLFVAYLMPPEPSFETVSDELGHSTPDFVAVVRVRRSAPGPRQRRVSPPPHARRRCFGREFIFSTRNVVIALAVLLIFKETQEIAIHSLKLLDSFTAVEAVEAVWHWLTGPLN